MNLLVVGGSGFVGSEFIKKAQESIHIKSITVLLRRSVNNFNNMDKVKIIVDKDSNNWERIIKDMNPKPNVVFSSLGATKGIKGNNEYQRKVDYDLNLSIAKASKDAGVKTFMVVTSFNNEFISTIFPYFKMKQELENAIEKQHFDSFIIIRPGPIVGDRSKINKKQSIMMILTSLIARITYNTCPGSFLGYPIKVEEISQSSMYLLETHNRFSGKKIITSKEMFSLSLALNFI